jgi:hypothetical protein
VSQLAFRQTLIFDDYYRGTMEVILISGWIYWCTRENIGCTWAWHHENTKITNTLWKRPGCLCEFLWRTAGAIRDTPTVYKQSISVNATCYALTIGHIDFGIIHGIIVFNIVTFTSLYGRTNENGKWFKYRCRYTNTVTWLSDQMISALHAVNVIDYIAHLIRINKRRNTQCICDPKLLEVVPVFADNLYQAC